jgi:hypothetical protein
MVVSAQRLQITQGRRQNSSLNNNIGVVWQSNPARVMHNCAHCHRWYNTNHLPEKDHVTSPAMHSLAQYAAPPLSLPKFKHDSGAITAAALPPLPSTKLFENASFRKMSCTYKNM